MLHSTPSIFSSILFIDHTSGVVQDTNIVLKKDFPYYIIYHYTSVDFGNIINVKIYNVLNSYPNGSLIVTFTHT